MMRMYLRHGNALRYNYRSRFMGGLTQTSTRACAIGRVRFAFIKALMSLAVVAEKIT